uniref:CD209 antigen-like protein C n=1 Tax=Oncorhynchus gorbuscha TaxID=8017 RepID=UPI001EAE94D7|nr:CD209 antigen-like protein C [Oncorhynchus gorbuscha]
MLLSTANFSCLHFQWWKRPYKVAALCLGLLCVLLLAGIIGLGVHYRDQLQTSYSTLTKDRDQLQRETIRLNKKLKGRPCHEGWIKFETSCYFFSTVNKTWEESRMDCIRREAHLVIINNREEQVFINGLNGANKQIWIGLTDTFAEGTWKWVDGTPLTTTYWGDGQPNSWKETEQDCGEFVHRSTDPGDWNDDGCSVEQYCVCEK